MPTARDLLKRLTRVGGRAGGLWMRQADGRFRSLATGEVHSERPPLFTARVSEQEYGMAQLRERFDRLMAGEDVPPAVDPLEVEALRLLTEMTTGKYASVSDVPAAPPTSEPNPWTLGENGRSDATERHQEASGRTAREGDAQSILEDSSPERLPAAPVAIPASVAMPGRGYDWMELTPWQRREKRNEQLPESELEKFDREQFDYRRSLARPESEGPGAHNARIFDALDRATEQADLSEGAAYRSFHQQAERLRKELGL